MRRGERRGPPEVCGGRNVMAEIYVHGYGLLCERGYCVWHPGQWVLWVLDLMHVQNLCGEAYSLRHSYCGIDRERLEDGEGAPENDVVATGCAGRPISACRGTPTGNAPCGGATKSLPA